MCIVGLTRESETKGWNKKKKNVEKDRLLLNQNERKGVEESRIQMDGGCTQKLKKKKNQKR